MGYIRDHAIIVSSWDDRKLKFAHSKAVKIFGFQVSSIVDKRVNDGKSFFIGPDGSKEGWDESALGDKQRAVFIKYINSKAYGDGSNSLSYVEVFFNDDNGRSEVVNHN